MTDGINRRTLLRGAAGGAAVLATGGLPAWARPVRKAHFLRQPDSLPFPHLPAGTPSMPQIRNIVVLMMENHSFDNLLGMVPYQVSGRHRVDGLTRRHHRIVNFNPDATGQRVYATHGTSPCQLSGEPSQSWNASHESYDGGRNDGFVKGSAPIAMTFWDKSDLPFTYSLAQHFPLGERYFCSVLAQTYPNRRFLFAATASGTISTNAAGLLPSAANGTIFDRLDAHNIDWRVYFQQIASPLILPNFRNNASQVARTSPFSQFAIDAAAGKPSAVHVPGSQLRQHIGGEPAGHPGRRGVRRERRPDAHARADVEAHGALHQLRRARRLLRPRPPAPRHPARLDPADALLPAMSRGPITATASACP